MRLALAAAATLALTGCQVVSLLLPAQSVQVLNRATTTVLVRIAPFHPGGGIVEASAALKSATLAAGAETTVSLPPAHYAVYAQVDGDDATNAASDFTLARDRASSLTLTEHFIDHASRNIDPNTATTGYQQRAIDWDIR